MRATQNMSGACDQRRQTWHPAIGCDVDAVSSGSWPRGESPCATPPPVVPEGLQVPGQVSAKSSAGHVQFGCSRAIGEAQDRSASRIGRRKRMKKNHKF